jgi:hypothetical protein
MDGLLGIAASVDRSCSALKFGLTILFSGWQGGLVTDVNRGTTGAREADSANSI